MIQLQSPEVYEQGDGQARSKSQNNSKKKNHFVPGLSKTVDFEEFRQEVDRSHAAASPGVCLSNLIIWNILLFDLFETLIRV